MVGPPDLQTFEVALARHRARRLPFARWVRQAAVACVLFEDHDVGPSVLLVRRAEREGDPWSGHMAMPGGMVEAGDADTKAAAERETHEETGIALSRDGRYLGRLSTLPTAEHRRRRPMYVTPFAYRLPTPPVVQPEAGEVVEGIAVPLAFLAEPANRRTMTWRKAGVTWKLPCYWYQDRRIWGLTLSMLDEVVKLARRC